ncbi:MAG: rod-binding protein [Planctomycetota bacterium]|jgi:flagellar protein FlgJ|nr:rod-binding protein [Planctomycetota bacterium]
MNINSTLTPPINDLTARALPNLGALENSQIPSGKKGLEKVAKEFESLFLSMMMKQMRQSVKKNELFSGGRGEEIFQPMLDQEFAAAGAQSQSLGIARLLVDQFSNHVSASENSRVLPHQLSQDLHPSKPVPPVEKRP